MVTEKFTKEHMGLTKDFECGNYIIDRFIKCSDALDENQGITYVMLSKQKDVIIGFYNIEAGRIDQIEQTGGLISYKSMGGAVNINYLAIHSSFQKKKIGVNEGRNIYLGDLLLNDCEKRILDLRKKVGISFVTLCSTNEGYYLYKVRNSYEDFEDDMSISISDRDVNTYKMYKCVDDILSVSEPYE